MTSDDGSSTTQLVMACKQGDNDLNLTLPLASRRKGDHGPTFPFDLGDYELTEVIGRGGMGRGVSR
jgi:eukaryotic-like serine/threonine-protein kinase